MKKSVDEKAKEYVENNTLPFLDKWDTDYHESARCYFKAGYAQGVEAMREAAVKVCKKRLKMYEPSRMYWSHHDVGRVAEAEEILKEIQKLNLCEK